MAWQAGNHHSLSLCLQHTLTSSSVVGSGQPARLMEGVELTLIEACTMGGAFEATFLGAAATFSAADCERKSIATGPERGRRQHAGR